MRIRIARGFWTSRVGIGVMCSVLVVLVVGTSVLAHYYIEFGRMVRERLTGQIFQNTSRVYSAPGRIYTGETLSKADLEQYLMHAGYQEGSVPGSPGEFDVSDHAIEIKPSEDSYFKGTNAERVEFSGPYVSRIVQIPGGVQEDFANVEPQLVTNLFDSAREKRRVVGFDDLPKNLVNSVLAAEDKRFYDHGAVDIVRVAGAALADLRLGRKAQGASTIDMQVARSFFFTLKRNWQRKIKEVLMAVEIDQRFSKQQIFELYGNEVYLGNRGSFSIRGFGEAANAYFGKDVRELNLGECAFLAGIIRAPNYYSLAEHHLDRADEARDRVLAQMVEDGYVTQSDADQAKETKLKFVRGGIASGSAPYFVDMVRDHLTARLSETDLENQSFRIYTTLDPQLQHAASEAVEIGMANVDKLLARRYAIWKKKGEAVPQVQCALVAMDPHTGEIRALVGGRNYGESQLNHAVARRQPGSVFKPFVYAAAFDNSVQNLQPVVTPATTVDDVPTTFEFDGKEYTPNNYGEEFFGTVTVHDALMHSLNVATVKVAEMIGYQRVVDLARQMGLGNNIQATPAVALGAYEMTPIDVAAGYTAFATNGTRAEPLFIRSVIASDGGIEEQNNPQNHAVLDPRVAYLTTSLMEDVINHGTGISARYAGFTAPAAGKTGTSRDGWFAGFTSNLLCVVWIGFDDNRDLALSGTATAAPMWGEFMKRAMLLPAYRNAQEFDPPAGLIQEVIDPETGQLATPQCPKTVTEYFVSGSEPGQFCEMHGGAEAAAQGGSGSWLSRLFGHNPNPAPPTPGVNGPPTATNLPPNAKPPNTKPGQQPENQPEPEKKKGLLDKIFGIFGGSKKPSDKPDKDKNQDQP